MREGVGLRDGDGLEGGLSPKGVRAFLGVVSLLDGGLTGGL